jgi:non-lysosomal glucosylceramidase
MLWEGLTMEGLAVMRMLHDRYHAARRNPWNEIECGDHYARSMASHGVYLAACGFEYDGPIGRLGFAPRLTPENFKCAFTTAEGWGSFTQKVEGGSAKCEVKLCWGKLTLRSLRSAMPKAVKPNEAKVRLRRKTVRAKLTTDGRRVQLEFSEPVELRAGQILEVALA